MMELNGGPARPEQIKALALTNYGHFTSMLVDEGRVRGLSLHLERLTRDCRRLFDADLDTEKVRHLTRHALEGVSQPIVVRVTVFDPNLELGHPDADADPHVLVTSRTAGRTPQPPLRLQSAFHCRDLPEVKHVGLFGTLRLRRVAQVNGYDDMLFTDAQANVSEAVTSNVGFFDGESVVWPKAEVLTGVTMALLRQTHGGQTVTAPVNLAQLGDMRAAFATNAVAGVRAITSVDDTRWTDQHPVIERLRQEYEAVHLEPL
jgi:branched-subunit amino acid aminotransferase/4-amino-4-deoxychorismate lyase